MTARVAFLTTHPIQYQVPVFRCLEAEPEIDFEVLFCHLPDARQQGDGFGVEFQWDIPLLEGYRHRVLKNVAANPSVTHHRGCDTPEIGDVIQDRQYDAVVINGWVVKSCLQGLNACRRLRVPCIVRGEANNLRPRPWWKRLLQRQLVRRFDAYLPIGNASRDFYRSHGIDDRQMFDARYCIENERFAKASESVMGKREELRQRWDIQPGETCFMFCGKFESKKHPLELIQAFEKSLDPSSPTRLLMVGDGDLRRECQHYAESRNLPVTFAGFLNQSEIVEAYVASDMLTLPSDHGETWGLVVNEAMVCGRGAIVSDQAGCAYDLIDEAETGFVFRFGDWDSLATLLRRCGSDEIDLQELGRKARHRVETYSPAAAAKGIVDAVDYCLTRTRK